MAISGTETHENAPSPSPSPSPTRPPRKRKAVQRFPIEPLPRRSATRKIVVYQGYGTPLKDIPNVAFKLSKRKTDNNLMLLHVILFGKKAKAQMLKKNLGLFSGFLWVEEEEKQRSKVRKKLDQCVKAKLLDFCNILDIPVNKATVKKEDLSAMVLKFLESPHPTTETLLANKEKTRKLTHNSRVGAKHQQSKIEEEDKKSESSTGEDHSEEDSDDEEGNDSEGDRENERPTHTGMRPAVSKIYLKECGNSKTQVKGHSAKSPKPTSRKRSSSSSSKEGTSETETESKASVVKKPKVEKKSNKNSEAKTESKSSSVKTLNVGKKRSKGQNACVSKTSSKMNASSKSPAKAKMIGQGKNRKKVEAEVTREELHSVLVDILKKVDLNTATLADILAQLGAHFNVDLSHRKAEVRASITDIINKMFDEDEEPDTGNHTDNEDDNDTYYD